jgi:hypothetical protein
MTDQDKIEQEVRLGVESKHAADDLAHEREHVLRLADDLVKWASWLQSHANKQPEAADFMPGGDVNDINMKADGRLRECLSFENLVRAEESLRKARQKASNLELRRMQLSSPPTFKV